MSGESDSFVYNWSVSNYNREKIPVCSFTNLSVMHLNYDREKRLSQYSFIDLFINNMGWKATVVYFN